jgi:sirohydrochlorin ferrochelatase
VVIATAVVLAAHGSRLADANVAHTALSRRVADRLGVPVVPGFLELTEPTIAEAIETAIVGGADRVLVLPYFLHPGNHTAHDIPAIVDAAREHHPGVVIELLALFGADGRLGDLITDQVRAVDGLA